MPSQDSLRLLVIGAGNRGRAYTRALRNNEQVIITGISDPNKIRRNALAKMYKEFRPDAEIKLYEDWKETIADADSYDGVIICTMDQMHREIAVIFANLGKHMLCEKPMATTWSDCQEIFNAVIENKVIFAMGHVLRYSPHNVYLKKLLDDGVIGEIINMNHTEPVGWYHYAHSYVRGNWRRKDVSTFSLMAKCCHDIDVLMWIMGRENCKRVSSFGSLSYFRAENKPAAAKGASNCTTCPMEENCAYSAKKLYMDSFDKGDKEWTIKICDEDNRDALLKALETSDYGRCVYDCDNDVCDNQVVNLDFGKATATMTMIAQSKEVCNRKMCFYGTTGEIYSDSKTIEVFDFVTKKSTFHKPEEVEESGHGGGDLGLATAFANALVDHVVHGKTVDAAQIEHIKCTPEDVLVSHKVVFLAEQSRLNGSVSGIDDKITI
ncbi:unnamed protein product [Kuraishia capsulata CBS 1993]|uniref:Gfo/Idh/MocA-like oxidoreductase N-terminal domain-containing protein n=1 Tax=Kuraishia capsulata CBS 1993 TaxID=1382522 RepID=W6MJF8_9ASCO|nr:uncharacterized protein KUCA_T00002074001 [Kuraishia capsulata CBS 1993]CDK26103.1 unnamed protein product [Kuraishia capsulata CBS 1993]